MHILSLDRLITAGLADSPFLCLKPEGCLGPTELMNVAGAWMPALTQVPYTGKGHRVPQGEACRPCSSDDKAAL